MFIRNACNRYSDRWSVKMRLYIKYTLAFLSRSELRIGKIEKTMCYESGGLTRVVNYSENIRSKATVRAVTCALQQS